MLGVDVELVVWCESIRKGCCFTARITDGAHARFYSGTGSTAFEAIAWALHDYVARALLGRDATPAMPLNLQPGDGLAAEPAPSSSSRSRRVTPSPLSAPIVIGPPLADDPKTSVGCFERVIPRAAAPRLHHEITTPSLTTSRRARGGRR